jgi:hypothetical protein
MKLTDNDDEIIEIDDRNDEVQETFAMRDLTEAERDLALEYWRDVKRNVKREV